MYSVRNLQLRAGGYESLSCLIAGELLEVLDEASGEILGLNLPLLGGSIGVAGIEDVGVHLVELGRDGKVEVRDGCGLSLVHAAVEDAVDDGAGILDGDTLAGTVPAGVHEVSGGAYFLHSLDELLTVLGGMQGEECCSEASGESGGRLGDTALCSGELGGEAAQEVVFGLLGGQLGNGRVKPLRK